MSPKAALDDFIADFDAEDIGAYSQGYQALDDEFDEDESSSSREVPRAWY